MNRRKFISQVAIAAAAVPVVAVPVEMPAAADPVFALAQERDAVIREYSAPDLDDATMDALEGRLSSVEARLAAAQCLTSAAIAEKLRVVVGMEAFNDKSAERIVRSALDDLAALERGDRWVPSAT